MHDSQAIIQQLLVNKYIDIMIVFIRHAERGDNQIPMRSSEIEYDPPIIQASAETVAQTSSQLNQIFQKHNIKQFQIVSSKFLRCLMTARLLQQNLQHFGYKMKENYYKIDDRIGQYLRQDWYKQYPMDNLIYHTKHLSKYIPVTQFNQINKSRYSKSFPQNYVKFHLRVADFKKQLRFPQAQTCLLVVTHGFVVRELCFTMNQLPRYQNQIKYCGYAAYIKDKGGEVLVKAKL